MERGSANISDLLTVAVTTQVTANVELHRYFKVSSLTVAASSNGRGSCYKRCKYEEKELTLAHVSPEDFNTLKADWRRPCGCLKTSDKLKELLKSFPAPPPPPSPASHASYGSKVDNAYSIVTRSSSMRQPSKRSFLVEEKEMKSGISLPALKKTISAKSWHVITELVQFLQLSVAATALALYYIIYAYMQLVYFTLRSAMFFHNADGPMKVTIGVVTATSLIVGFNILLRMERLVGIKVID